MSLSLALTLHPGVYVAVGIALLVVVVIIGSFLNVWLKAWSSGAPVDLVNLITMRYLRKLPHSLIVDSYIMVRKARLPVEFSELVELYESDPESYLRNVSSMIEESESK